MPEVFASFTTAHKSKLSKKVFFLGVCHSLKGFAELFLELVSQKGAEFLACDFDVDGRSQVLKFSKCLKC